MPWKRMVVDDQRMQFVICATSGTERIAVWALAHPQTQGKWSACIAQGAKPCGNAGSRNSSRRGPQRWRSFKAPTTIGVRTKP